MKIKIGDLFFDVKDEPVMIILSEQDKKNIENMCPTCTKYAIFPDGWLEDEEKMREWMRAIPAQNAEEE